MKRPRWMSIVDPFTRAINPLFMAGFLAIAAVLAFIYVPDLTNGSLKRKTQCVSNMKQLSTGLVIYSADNNDQLPISQWADPAYPYVKNWGLFSCDAIRREGLKWGYAMNLDVLGVNISNYPSPSQTILLFETDALGQGVIANLAAVAHARHGKKIIVSRLDTSTKTVDPQTLSRN